jgi:hypothetical protein
MHDKFSNASRAKVNWFELKTWKIKGRQKWHNKGNKKVTSVINISTI